MSTQSGRGHGRGGHGRGAGSRQAPPARAVSPAQPLSPALTPVPRTNPCTVGRLPPPAPQTHAHTQPSPTNHISPPLAAATSQGAKQPPHSRAPPRSRPRRRRRRRRQPRLRILPLQLVRQPYGIVRQWRRRLDGWRPVGCRSVGAAVGGAGCVRRGPGGWAAVGAAAGAGVVPGAGAAEARCVCVLGKQKGSGRVLCGRTGMRRLLLGD